MGEKPPLSSLRLMTLRGVSGSPLSFPSRCVGTCITHVIHSAHYDSLAPQCKPLHHDQTHETRRLRFVMPHVRPPAPNNPLLCITCHRMAKLSRGHDSLSGSHLFLPCMRSRRAVLCLACCYGKSRASYWLSHSVVVPSLFGLGGPYAA